MELSEIFQTLRNATIVFADKSLTFEETNDEGDKVLKKKQMSLQTYIVRAFAERLLADVGKSQDEIEDALKIDGEVVDEDEVPTGNPFTIKLRFGGSRRKTTRRRRSNV